MRVDGIQPLFLDAVRTKQTVHILGSFPEGTHIEDTAPLSVVDDEVFIDQDELFANVVLADTTPQSVFLIVATDKERKSIQFNVMPACPTPQMKADDLSSTLVAPGAGRCNLPKGQTFTAFNAKTGEITDNGTAAFCDDSTGTSGTTFDVKSTYLDNKSRVRFVVCNKNPFNYTTKLTRDEQPIQNDDLSTFLGVLDPALGASQAAKAASDTAAQKSASTSTTKTVTPKTLTKALPKKVPFAVADPTQSCLNTIVSDLQTLDISYTNLVHQYLISEARLQDDDLTCSQRLTEAQKMWTTAKTLTLDTTVQSANQKIAALRSAIDQRIADASNGPYSNNSLTHQQIASMQAVESALNTQSCIAGKAAQIISNQLAKNVIAPLETVLGDRDSFVYSTFFGPYQQPTSVRWVLASTKIDKTKGISSGTDLGSDPYVQCLSQQNPSNNGKRGGQVTVPQNGSQPPVHADDSAQEDSASTNAIVGSHLSRVSLISDVAHSGRGVRLENPALTVSSDEQNDAQDSSTGQDSTADSKNNKNNKVNASQSDNTQQPSSENGAQLGSGVYTFGGPKVVVSAGVAGVVLRNRQFQKVQASGQTSGSTIEYSTNSLARISPMIMAHARLFSYKGSDKAIWGTVGVTAASNDKGVSAEYLVGVTQSFVNNWVFLTPGLYIGQTQSLSGGYKVGQQLPSSFTGSLPIEQNYKIGFGFAISFRIPGTATPKTKSSSADSSSSANGGASKKKGTKTTS
jgi:hypothetical protein